MSGTVEAEQLTSNELTFFRFLLKDLERKDSYLQCCLISADGTHRGSQCKASQIHISHIARKKRKEKNASAWLKGWANPTPKGHEVRGGSEGNGAGGMSETPRDLFQGDGVG
jgi:hypothetical protein